MVLSQEAIQAIIDASFIIKSSRYVTALTGAGVSVESNIRPFRGPGGLWTEKGEPSMDGYQRFQKDPRSYWNRRLDPDRKSGLNRSMLNAKPNAGHLALSKLEELGILKFIITQNTDNLHFSAGNKKVLEIHGNTHYLRCIDCGKKWHKDDYKIIEIPPRCSECNGLVKGDTVMFGEPIPIRILNRCFEEAKRSDCMLILGTSATVHPAASLPILTKRNGGKLIELNIRPSEISYLCDVNIIASFANAMPKIVEEIIS
jgi:NAD-dependent deacetylase